MLHTGNRQPCFLTSVLAVATGVWWNTVNFR